MPVERCPICGGETERLLKKFRHTYYGVPIIVSEIPHLVCAECGEELIDSRYGRIIEETIDQYRKFRNFEPHDLLTCEEVSAFLAVSYQVVIAMLNDGKLPGTKIGREWRVPYGVLIEYIQSISAHNLSQPERNIYRFCNTNTQEESIPE
ncbi:MAG: helix-turn-helix domain-containing protein [Halanaerobiales bacterium]|nr:helix-turn-helix domain-containing protein [Halanaerobiales bacterium]